MPALTYRVDDNDGSTGLEAIRVQVSLLDSLMTLAGELVLSRNQLLQTITVNDLKCAESVGQRIDLITSELQEAIMHARMQPIGTIFDTLPGVVNDIADVTGKRIELSIFGRDVELDKTIIDAISAPLLHLVRRAAEYGIDSPDQRSVQDKPRQGTILLGALHEAGQVVIEIKDDGVAPDSERIAIEAVRSEIVSLEQCQGLSDKEKLNLAFSPGLCCADSVPRVDGFGDVKAAIDKLGGQIEIDEFAVGGTVVSVRLPLTLAIIPCQVIMSEDERYAIPQANLEELLRIPAIQVKERIELVGSAEVVRLRGKLLPLVRLADVLEIQRTYIDPDDDEIRVDRRLRIADRRSRKADSEDIPVILDQEDLVSRREAPDRRQSANSALNIVVVSAGNCTYGLIVDSLQDSEEIVIKPLDRHLQQCRGYAGATIMGNGRIALILDVANLAAMAQLTLMGDHLNVQAGDSEATENVEENHSMLIFRCAEHEQFGIRLDQVERIEKIKRGDIENLGGKRVMQYRGGSLNLIGIDEVASVQPLAEHDDLLIMVFSYQEHSVGLLACGPIDTREIGNRIDDTSLRQPGIAGSVIIDGQTTMVVDIDEMVGRLYPEWSTSSGRR
nr:chemotaxis protein CheW [Desulfogranum marinum]